MIEAVLTLLLLDFKQPSELISRSITFSTKHYTCEKIIEKHTKLLPLDNKPKNYFLTKDGKFAIMGTICPDWRQDD